MLITVHIQKHQRGFLFRRGDFVRILPPGSHRLWARLLRPGLTDVRLFNTVETLFTHPMLEVLAREPEFREALHVLELNDAQRALVWRGGRLAFLLGPGLHALWKEPYPIEVEIFETEMFRFEHPRLEAVLAFPGFDRWLARASIGPQQEVLVFRDGALVDRFSRGSYAYWKTAGSIVLKAVSTQEQALDVAGQEIMTSDKLSIRVNLSVAYRVADTVKAVTTVADFQQRVYREAQLVLRAAVGTRTLDALLGDKEAVGTQVREELGRRVEQFGVVVRSIGIKDIMLPGDMKALLKQVIAAEKEAQANLIKRREETAAARSQANTARLLAENPVLARMRELEALQAILAGAKTVFVMGDGDIARKIGGLISAEKQTGT